MGFRVGHKNNKSILDYGRSVNVRAKRIVKINLEHSSKYADKGIFAVFLYAFR